MDDFEAHRGYLRAVAYRVLGSANEADDAVQEAWLRLNRAGRDTIGDTRAWLTTVVARVCLDMLRFRKARREVSVEVTAPADGPDPEQEAMLSDSVGLALLIVLDTLTPAERLAFVLHDVFAVPFTEIAQIVGRTVPAAKMLASRARQRVRSAQEPGGLHRKREVVAAFLAAARGGDFAALLDLLDPGVSVRADAAAVPAGSPAHLRGARPVAKQALAFSSRAKDAHIGIVNGEPAILVTPHGRLVTVMSFTITAGRITAIEVIAEPVRLGRLTINGQ